MNLRKTVYKKYKKRALLHAVVLSFFLLSSLIFSQMGIDKSTKYPVEITQNNLSVTYIEGGLDGKKEQLYVAFSVPFEEIDPLKPFEIIAKNSKGSAKGLKSQTTKIFEDYFISYIELPKGNWNMVSIEIVQFDKEKDEPLSSGNGDKITIYRKGLEGKSVSEKSLIHSYYKEKHEEGIKQKAEIKEEIKQLKSEIKELETTIEGFNQSIETAPEDEVPTIESKKQETLNLIAQKEGNILECEEEKEIIEKKIDVYAEHLKK